MATNHLFRSGKYEKSMSNDGKRVITMNIQTPQRGLVFFGNKDAGKCFALDAKCKNTDKRSIIKCAVKAILMEMCTLNDENSSEAVKRSYNAQKAYLPGILSCSRVVVTDNKGEFITTSELKVDDVTFNGKLGDIINIDKKAANTDSIYSLVVMQRRPWTDSAVIVALKYFVEAAVQHIDYMQKLDKALLDAANSTEREQAEADKKAKDAAEKRAAAKAAKEAKEAAAA